MTKQALVFIVLAAACLGLPGQDEETCCQSRDLAMMPTPMPAGQEQDLTNLFEGAVLHPLIWDAIESMDASCPEISFYDLEAKAAADDRVAKIDAAVRKQKGWPPDPDPWKPPPPEKDMDYVLRGTLTANQVTGKDLSGNLEGTFTFHLALVDLHHQNAVLMEKPVSWKGGIMHGLKAVEAMAESFRPLPPLLKRYERIPEKAKIDVPEDQAEAGETTTITISGLLDKGGQQAQRWQRLYVHVEKGKILNAERVEVDDGKDYYIFRAGKGTVEIQYLAPDDCSKVREKMTVFNCCEKREPSAYYRGSPKKEIGRKEFAIVCNRWDFTITYLEDVTVNQNEDGNLTQAARNYRMTLKGRLVFGQQHPGYIEFTAASAALELSDTLNQHRTFAGEPPQNIQASYSGQGRGEAFASVWLHIPRRDREPILFGWSNLKKPVSYKGTCQWWGWNPIADGAAEFSAQTLMALNNDNATDQIPEEALEYKEGQAVLSGEYSWQDMGTLVGTGGPFMLPFEEEEITWTRQPPVGAISLATPMSAASAFRHTIKWEFRKGGK
jgi:hypothetical protein